MPREGLEELIGAQALKTELKPALLACLTGRESRRWTVIELYERLNNLGIRCSNPAVLGALGELELEISLSSWLPWNLVEHGTEWILLPKNDVLELLSGIRRLPVSSAGSLTDEQKAVLLVVIAHRRRGGVSKTRIGEILRLDAAPHLEELRRSELVYTASGKELNWWRPTPGSPPGLGPAIHERDSRPQRAGTLVRLPESVSNPRRSGSGTYARESPGYGTRKRRRELERRASAPSREEDLR